MTEEAAGVGPRVWAKNEMTADPARPRMRTRWIISPNPDGWSDVALSEWELERAGWADRHPHTETNIVLAGELYVECDGHTSVVVEGQTVQVPGGSVGRYWAPAFARMLAVYGPNRDAEDTTAHEYWEL